MADASRFVGASLVFAVLAAPAVGVCAALVDAEDPCEMQESHAASSCGHAAMVMTGCCSIEPVDAAAEAILPGSAGGIAPPAVIGTGPDVPASNGLEAAVLACDKDPPPAVPRYRLYSALLL